MELRTVIKRRTSVRGYRPLEISDDKIQYILECARLSPSACNRQAWRLFVIQSKEMLAKIQTAYDRDWFKTAPIVIAVAIDHSKAWHRDMYDNKDHSDVDAAIISEHICLAATDKGLGSCWVCNFDPKIVSEVLPLKEGEEVVTLIPIGYPADDVVFKQMKTRLTVEDITEFL